LEAKLAGLTRDSAVCMHASASKIVRLRTRGAAVGMADQSYAWLGYDGSSIHLSLYHFLLNSHHHLSVVVAGKLRADLLTEAPVAEADRPVWKAKI
jgi:hypothetical protein